MVPNLVAGWRCRVATESRQSILHSLCVNHLRFGLVSALALAAWSHPALAVDDSDKEAIRSLSNQGAADFEQRRYEAARDKFVRAYEIARVPKLAVWAARANEKLGKLVTAYELYRQALGLEPNDLWKGGVQQQAQKDAQAELAQLQPRLPKLTIVIEGAKANEVSVKVDSLQVPSALLGVERFTDPGQRQIVGKRGDEVVNETVTLAEGSSSQIVLRFRKTSALTGAEPLPSKAASETSDAKSNPESAHDHGSSRSGSQRTWGWLSVGLGATGLALGASTGIWVVLKHSDLKAKCSVDNDCHGQYTSEVNTFNTMRTVSLIGFAVGGVAAATGVTLLLTAPKQKPESSVGLWLLPNATGITGTF
jgi:hypothetical protein